MKHLLLTTIAAVVLVGCGPSEPPDISIHEATERGDIEAVKQAIADGANVNAQNGGGPAPLHLAAHKGQKEITELLIDKGADVNARNNVGASPLALANGETAELLRKHGGKTGIQRQGRSEHGRFYQ